MQTYMYNHIDTACTSLQCTLYNSYTPNDNNYGNHAIHTKTLIKTVLQLTHMEFSLLTSHEGRAIPKLVAERNERKLLCKINNYNISVSLVIVYFECRIHLYYCYHSY